jgi:ATP-dependent Clp protease ATP-binding subunit ClpC
MDSKPDSPAPQNEFTPNAQQALNFAKDKAVRQKCAFMGTDHLLLGLLSLSKGNAIALLTLHGLNLESMRTALTKRGIADAPEDLSVENPTCTPRLLKVMEAASKEVIVGTYTRIGTEHLLLALLQETDGVVAHIFSTAGLSVEKMRLELKMTLALGEFSFFQSQEYKATKSTGVASEIAAINFTPRAQKA